MREIPITELDTLENFDILLVWGDDSCVAVTRLNNRWNMPDFSDNVSEGFSLAELQPLRVFTTEELIDFVDSYFQHYAFYRVPQIEIYAEGDLEGVVDYSDEAKDLQTHHEKESKRHAESAALWASKGEGLPPSVE